MEFRKLRLPPYFTASIRRQIAELYASTAIADLAIAIVMIFEPVFLYTVIKMPVAEILIFNGAIYLFYIVLIPFGARIVSRYGYEHGILFSIPFQVLFWVFLYAGKDNPGLLYWAPLIYAIEKSLFWPAFHASCARFARDEQRGREFSVLYAIVNIVYIVGPFLGGWISDKFSIQITFVVASAIYICSFIPLFTTKEVFVPKLYEFKDTLDLYRAYPLKALGNMGFGEEMLLLNAWPIYIYLAVKGYEEAGALVTGATLVATVLALYVGKISDQYSKRILVKIGSFFYSLTWLLKIVSINVPAVFAADSLSRTSKDMVFIPVSTLTYERAEAGHIMPYVVFFEQSLAIGKLLAAIIGAILFYYTGSFVVLFIEAAVFSLLYMLI